MTPLEFMEKMAPVQEKKGYYFGRDKENILFIISGLLENKKRYGYMSCPCRLGSGNIEIDRDILCPCVYREEDVANHGTCYCGLYFSLDALEGRVLIDYNIPDRRPPEKILAGLSGLL